MTSYRTAAVARPRSLYGLCDDAAVPLICPTCRAWLQALARSAGPGNRRLLCMGLFSIFWRKPRRPGVKVRRPIRQASGAYRVIYLATIGDAIHVLHAFQKKTQATAKRDIDLARARLRQIG